MKPRSFLAVLLMVLTGVALAADPGRSGGQQPAPTQQHQHDSHQQGHGPNDRAGVQTGDPGRAGVDASDQRFVAAAAEGGRAEVAMGKLATQKASHAEVKRFGQRMIDDHDKANQELKQIAAQKGITLPPDNLWASSTHGGSTGAAGRPAGSPSGQTDRPGQARQPGHQVPGHGEHQAMMGRLSRLSGAEFDREYMRGQLKDHEKTIALFEQQANQGKDRELKAFAAKTLPVLREHDRMARQIARTVGVTGTGR